MIIFQHQEVTLSKEIDDFPPVEIEEHRMRPGYS